MNSEKRAELNDLLSDTPYTVVSELGWGATADVVVVRQKLLRKKFALKLLRPHLHEEQGHLERLRREARCLGQIESPHVVGIVDMGRAKNGLPYVVLDLMKGHSLATELDLRGKLPIVEAIKWASQTLAGLSAAHHLGLIHRDITPANLFLETKPERPRILKIMDFGLARVLPVLDGVPPSGAMTTSTGTIVGSPVYASPEALRGERLGATADIFGVGLVLFQMLTGKGPLELGGTSVPPPSKWTPGVSPTLDGIVNKATLSSPDERYGSAIEFLAELTLLNEKADA